jgi:hypothetical protein
MTLHTPRLMLLAMLIVGLASHQPARAQDSQTRDRDWVSITYPNAGIVGQTAELQLQVDGDAIEQDLRLRVDPHWFEGRQRRAGGPRSRVYDLPAGQDTSLDVQMRVPDREGITAVQYVIYAGPSGNWADKMHSAEAGFRVSRDGEVAGGAAADAEPASPSEPQPSPDRASGGVQTHESQWITVRHPAAAVPGEQVQLQLHVDGDAIEQDGRLRVDTHWFEGRQRRAGGPRSGLIPLTAGQDLERTITLRVPDRDGIAALAYIIYAGPSGDYADRTHHTSVGLPVRAASDQDAAEPTPAPPPQRPQPQAQPAAQAPAPAGPPAHPSPTQPRYTTAHDAAWTDARLPRWTSPVPAEAVVLEGPADIRWMPEPFVFEPGDELRYIDYDHGEDTHSGRSPDQAWKHHPWDPAARGNAAEAQGVDTYVFRRGVTYRGALVARESGTAQRPIQLTSDPDWGQGEAIIAGSVPVTDWRRVDDAQAAELAVPDAARGRVWAARVEGYVPWAMWLVDADQRQRLTPARFPNWQIEHEYNHFTQWLRVDRIDQGFPRTSIYAPDALPATDPDAYDGATLWIDHANTSGEFSIIGPFPSGVGRYDPETGRLQPSLNHPRRHPQPNAPFYLENLPRFLDQPGEWCMVPDADADGATLYLRLPGDADPNARQVEAARHHVLLDIPSQQHLAVSGLTFTAGNSTDLTRAGDYDRPGNFTQMAAVRLTDSAQHIDLHHLVIRDTAGVGITNYYTREGQTTRDIRIADSQFADIDASAIAFEPAASPIRLPAGTITGIDVLRNRFNDIGFRCAVNQGGQAIDISGLLVGEIAGNVIQRTAAQGINVIGGRFGVDQPLIRILIHRNRVNDSLIYKTDFGGIEFWGVGPAYVFNNISSNAVGWVAHRNVYHKNQVYYFDHGARGYLFNNIGWSDSRDDAWHGILGQYFFKEIRNRWNVAFHNTAYNFHGGQSHASRHGDQQHYLANLFINCRIGSTSHWRLAEATGIAWAANLIAGDFEFVYSRSRGDQFLSPDAFRRAAAPLGNLLNAQFGWATDAMPVQDPAAHDFRLTDDSAAIDRGLRVFVPWALAGTVGEWHFRPLPADPTRILAYDAYVQPFHRGHEHMRLGAGVPQNELVGDAFALNHYAAGPTEDWTASAATFDGERTLVLPHDQLTQSFQLQRRGEAYTVDSESRHTVRMSTNNFLVEAVLRVEPAASGGTVAGLIGDDAGYELAIDPDGRLMMRLRGEGDELVQLSDSTIHDGRWHHVLAEVDRDSGSITFYINGQRNLGSRTGALPAGVSLHSDADFVVGAGFRGAIDYLRVSRGTLAQARTDIDELMAWQFNGPAQHDIAGRPASGEARDIGAIEHTTAHGQQPIRYQPRTAAAGDAQPDPSAEPDTFRTGEGRTVRTLDWGAVSVPESVAPGGELDVHVAFGTETIPRPMRLHIDLHVVIHGNRRPGIGRASPVNVTPGVTTPYSSVLTVHPREGLERVMVVIYATPDGTYANRILSTEVGVPVVRDPS